MARTLLDLAKSLERRAVSVGKVANERKKDYARVILRQLAYNTPVDTSEALSNWLVGIGGKVSGVIPARVPGSKGSTQRFSAEETIAEGLRAIDEAQPGQSIFISNNTPQIVPLNYGQHSQQGYGFVEYSLLYARRTVGLK